MTDLATTNTFRQDRNGLWVIPRDEFADNYYQYEPGNHELHAGPTRRGKSTLIHRLAKSTATQELPHYVIQSKPKDAIIAKFTNISGFKLIRDYPPKASLKDMYEDKPRGYVLHPQFGSFDEDRTRVREIIRKLLADRYLKGIKGEKCVIIADDLPNLSLYYQLDEEMTQHVTMSGAMGVGIKGAVQKPTGAGKTSLWLYGACEHAFIFSDPDKRNRERYGEIGGVDPKLVERVSLALDPYQCLYFKRSGGYMCIVDSK